MTRTPLLRLMTIFFSILLCLTAAVAAAAGNLAFSFHKSDAAGQGMTKAYAFFVAFFLWLLLGAVLLTCAVHREISSVTATFLLVFYLIAAAGYFTAMRILEGLESGDRFESLLRTVVVASPSLLILYSLCIYFPGLGTLLPGRAPNLLFGLPVLILSALPWLVMESSAAATTARREARQKAFEEKRQQEEKITAEIQALPAEAPLSAFLPYIDVPPGNDSNSRYKAVQRMSKLARRQTEAEELLDQQELRILAALRELDLQMTPSLCKTARKCARKAIEQLKPPSVATTFDSMESTISDYWQSIRWMLQNGCDCKEEIAALENVVHLYPESFPRKLFLDHVMETLGKPRED